MVTIPIWMALRNTRDPRNHRTGIVTEPMSAGDAQVTVDIDGEGGVVVIPYMGDLRQSALPDVGDVLLLLRSAGRLIAMGVIGGDTVSVPDPPTEPEPEPTTVKVTLRPKATGTTRGGSVRGDTNDLYQGDWTGRGVNSGMAVYKARHLSGSVTRITVRLKRLDAGVYAAQAPTLRLMSQNSLVGSPTWLDSVSGPSMKVGDVRNFVLPDSWGQQLINGSAGGIGIHVNSSSPYVRLAGKNAGFMSLTLTIEE